MNTSEVQIETLVDALQSDMALLDILSVIEAINTVEDQDAFPDIHALIEEG